MPKHAHGTHNLKNYTCFSNIIRDAVEKLFDKIVNPDLLVRRITIDVNHVKSEKDAEGELKQLGLFDRVRDDRKMEKGGRVDKAVLAIKKRYGKNAILKGINYEDGATGRERNAQIGGHRK